MAGFASDSGSEYDFDLTVSDEELLCAAADRLAEVSPQPQARVNPRPAPAIPATPAPRRTTTRHPLPSSPFSPNLDPDATFAVEEAIAAITDDDLSFDLSELQDDDFDESPRHGQHGQHGLHRQGIISRGSAPEGRNRRLAPSVASAGAGLASFVSKTKPRAVLALLPDPDVSYPDLSHALSAAQEGARLPDEDAQEQPGVSIKDTRSPMLRFRTQPKKPLSVTDLTAGAWCELQHFYTLTRLGGKKTRTTAMKRGTRVHEKLEREVFTSVQIEVTKKEDTFGLKIWNMIQGLRVLREQGSTREFEVWGMVDGNVVNGIIDGLSYDNPDEELEEDVLSSRGSSHSITNSQPYEPSTPGDYEIFITDVKTRNSPTAPPQTQVRGSIIQLFLYHRFLSDMAADRLDYLRVFARYGLNSTEPFSDAFMAQIGALHDEVFDVPDADDSDSSSTALDNDADADAEFVSAPSSPSQLSFPDTDNTPNLRYRTLLTLLPLLKAELALTFPRGAADLGKIVAVEYRYRGRDLPPQQPPTTTTLPPTTKPESLLPGSIICTNTFFVEPQTLDLFLAETMRWWTGARPPHGVPRDEAGFKCRSCEFREACEWRAGMDREALRRAGAAASASGSDSKRRGKMVVEEEEEEVKVKGGEEEVEIEIEEVVGAKRGRGRPRKVVQ